MEELIPLFSKISNQVLFDHYAKQISTELDLSEDTVFSMLRKGSTDQEGGYWEIEEVDQKFPVQKRRVEGYFISLTLKTSLDKAKEFVKKLKKEDFLNGNIADIFIELQEYLEDRKTDINIKSLINKFDEEKGKLVSDLYLWDFEGDLDDGENFEDRINKELEDIVERIKKDSIKRQLQILSGEIKIAETKKEEDELERLTKKFEKLSKSLL